MASGLSFITFNPATAAMRAGEQRSEQRRAADLSARQQERAMQWEENVDTAIRGGISGSNQPVAPASTATPVPPPTPAPAMGAGMDDHARGNLEREAAQLKIAPVAAPAAAPAPAAQAQPQQRPGGTTASIQQRLAATPGGGRMALQMQQQRDQQETQVMHLLSNPQTAHIGMAQAQKIGMAIPEQLASNTAFWQGASIAKQLYPDDTAAAQKFTTAFVQAGGQDVNAATSAGIQAAGAPVRRRRYGVAQGDQGMVFYDVADPSHQIQGPTKTTGQYLQGADGTTHFLQTGQTQTQQITGPDGQPFKGQKFGASAGGSSVYQQKYAAWLAAHPGDEQGALSYASGKTVLGQAQLQNLASQIVAREYQGSFGVKPEVKQARVQEVYQQLLQANNQQPTITTLPPAAGPGAAPQPIATPTTTPRPSAPPPTYSADGISGTFTGQYENGQPVYQTQDGRRFVVE